MGPTPKVSPVSLVTGSGAPRVGRTIASRLAERGHRIVLHANHSIAEARSAAEEFCRRGNEAIALQADLGDESSVQAMFGQIHDRFGRLDVLVNSAAIWEPKKLEDIAAADVRRHFEVNTLGTFLCCQLGGLRMTRQDSGGVIVNIGDWAIARPYVDYAAYFPSKGAIPALTRSFAVELARRNPRVRVNAVLPGPVTLPPDLPEGERRQAIEGTLVKREGSAENVAQAVVMLIENDFVTGVCLPVDGGRTIA